MKLEYKLVSENTNSVSEYDNLISYNKNKKFNYFHYLK